MNKPVALYLRVSTSLQSVEMQERDLRRYCRERNLHIYSIYIDYASGTKEKRPELNRLMDDVRNNKVGAVIVWRFDRFARSTKHLITALEEFKSLGVDFISHQENIQTDTHLGLAIFSIISAISELERNIITERVIAGINNARLKGKRLGRPKKRNDQKILELRKQGYSYRKIAQLLSIPLGSVQAALKIL